MSTSSCSVMVLVSNHCHSFFLLFFILAPRAYVNANEFTFPKSSSSQITVHWSIEQPEPANFLLTLVEDQPNALIATQPVTTSGRQSGDVTFDGLHLEPGTYRVTAGTDPKSPAFFGSSSELTIALSSSHTSSSGTTSRKSGSQTRSTVSPQATSSTTTGEATTTIVSATATSEETPSGENDGSGPGTSTGNLNGSGESAASQTGTSPSTVATTTNNPNALSSFVPATQKSSSETDAYVPSTDPAPSSSSSPVAASLNNDSSSTVGIIVGAVLGVIAFLGLLTCTGVVLLKRRNRKRAEQLLIRDILAAPPYSQRSSTMTRIVDDEVLEKQLLEWKYGPGGLAEEAGVQRRLQEWKYGGVSRCETPCSSV